LWGKVKIPGYLADSFWIRLDPEHDRWLLVLWPRAFRGVEAIFEKVFPKFHHQSMPQITRFLDDLEQRYPFEG
jgi:hypothetical protein